MHFLLIKHSKNVDIEIAIVQLKENFAKFIDHLAIR